jgi:hypothetical protein
MWKIRVVKNENILSKVMRYGIWFLFCRSLNAKTASFEKINPEHLISEHPYLFLSKGVAGATC